jgi:hypothetical protein
MPFGEGRGGLERNARYPKTPASKGRSSAEIGPRKQTAAPRFYLSCAKTMNATQPTKQLSKLPSARLSTRQTERQFVTAALAAHDKTTFSLSAFLAHYWGEAYRPNPYLAYMNEVGDRRLRQSIAHDARTIFKKLKAERARPHTPAP